MDNRPQMSTQRPPPTLQRTVSSSYALHRDLKRPAAAPSRLSNVRSISQPAYFFNLSNTTVETDASPNATFLDHPDRACASPEPVELENDENDRPVKRQRVDGDELREEDETRDAEEDNAHDDPTDSAHQLVPGSPLPLLQKQNNLPHKPVSFAPRRPRITDVVTRKANGINPPSMAIGLPSPKNVADFSPWTGRHPEDIMSETVIKAGYSDKPSGPLSAESNSAKPSIWPNLSQKNNMGLQTLSYLFTSVMDRRQAMGKCVAPSTFKPPPRVTVTDTKREAWLRDLSNPDVPLRKQSRTIPHGIRGKLLMEQCLSKNIPIPRSVWLAKCVGANELRAFRRKGVSGTAAAGGEQKWVREWTVHVEQFVEGVIASCGQPEWQSKMNYAVKLATAFFSERLLDRDQFLEWIVGSFADSPWEKLPIWIILAQVFWKDITAFARRGRRLATTILEHLHRITQQNLQVNAYLRNRLQKLLAVLAVSNRGCLILPRHWAQYKHLLTRDMFTSDVTPTLERHVQNISQRNERLTDPLLKTPQNTRCALLGLYSKLDAVNLQVDVPSIIRECSSFLSSPSDLIPAILDWSASVYRTGLSRIYLTSKIIAHLREGGEDTDGVILEYLQSPRKAAIDVRNIHRVLADLLIADRFSPGRYLQWLITHGALSGGEEMGLATGLLSMLPLEALPTHLHNTWKMLTRRLGHVVDEASIIERIQSKLDQTLQNQDVDLNESFVELESSSQSVKFAISRGIRAKGGVLTKNSSLTLHVFCVLRKALGMTEDIHALAEVLNGAISTDSALVLATLSDTLNLHALTLAAIGRLQPMLSMALARYRTLRSQQALDRTLILALTALVKRFPAQQAFTKLLKSDLAICEQQSSVAACSPASDNLVNMQASNLDSDDDIDAVFASGNVMDEQLMQRVFIRIVQRASKPSSTETNAPSKVCSWLAQLHSVDASGFDNLAKDYVKNSLQKLDDREATLRVWSALLASTCMTFDTIVNIVREANSPHAAKLGLDLLLSSSEVNPGLHTIETFRFGVQQELYLSDHAEKVTLLLRTCLDDPDFTTIQNERVVDLVLKYSTSSHSEGLMTVASDAQSPSAVEQCRQLFVSILRLGGLNETQLQPPSIVALADPLSIVHCAAALGFVAKHPSSEDIRIEKDLESAILQAVMGSSPVWPQLIERAGPDTIRGIYEWTRDQVLSSAVPESLNQEIRNPTEMDQQLDILNVTHRAAKDTEATQIAASITEKLRLLESQISALASDGSTAARAHRQITRSVHILLHFAVLFSTSTVDRESASDTLKQNQSHLLAALCSLLSHSKLQGQHALTEYVFDVASAVADTLPETTLSAISAKNSSRGGFSTVVAAKDLRIISILGSGAAASSTSTTSTTPATDSIATLASPLTLVSDPAAPSNPTQQQRTASFMKHQTAHQQPQQPSSLPMMNPAAAARQPPQHSSSSSLSSLQKIMRPPSAVSQHSSSLSLSSASAPGAGSSASALLSSSRMDDNTKYTPFSLRRWEIIPDATPSVGENDTCLSLSLFGARKV